jgi:predicted GNAT family N-acyltransferase
LAGDADSVELHVSLLRCSADRILGYYSLSAASLAFGRLTEADRKGVPAYPVPAVRIGRLASSLSVRGLGLGELLLQNAIKRIQGFSPD